MHEVPRLEAMAWFIGGGVLLLILLVSLGGLLIWWSIRHEAKMIDRLRKLENRDGL